MKRSRVAVADDRADITAAVPGSVVKGRRLRWFVPMPARMALDPGLSHAAFRLATLLLHYEGPRGCFPSQARLAMDLGTSLDSVQRYLRELELYGFLTRDKRRGFANRYELAPIYEEPIRHGSIKERGDPESGNAKSKRRPPAVRDLRVGKVPAATATLSAPDLTNDVRQRRADPPNIDVAAPMRLREEPPPGEGRAPVQLPDEIEAGATAAPVRPPDAATLRSTEPRECGSNKNIPIQKPHHQDAPTHASGHVGERIDHGGGEPGLAALQLAGVNVARRELGVHLGRGRGLEDAELLEWAEWVTNTVASGIRDKKAFAAMKVRKGFTLREIFPTLSLENRREEEAAVSAAGAALLEQIELDRIARANTLIEQLTADDRERLRNQALNRAVWLTPNTTDTIRERVIAAEERRIVLAETWLGSVLCE